MVATTPGFAKPAVVLPASGNHRHQLIAVDQMTLFIDDHDAVGIAVERDPDIGAHLAHLGGQRCGVGRTAILVDVEAVRIDAERDHLRAQFPQCFRRHLVGRAVRAIHHHAQTIER